MIPSIKRLLFDTASHIIYVSGQKKLEASLGRFKRCGVGVHVDPSVRFLGEEYIEVGDNTQFQPYSRIEAVDGYFSSGQKFQPQLKIGARCTIEFGVHIGACYCVDIGNDVMIGGRAFIADHGHHYEDPAMPVRYQPLSEKGRITIGDGSHIGEGACIFSDVTLGEHVVVGANAVVTKDVPAFCVVAGVPARILRHYDFERKEWVLGPPRNQ